MVRCLDHRQCELDLQINLLAEFEATKMLLHALCEHHGLRQAKDPVVVELSQRTEPKSLMRELRSKLPEGQ